jgi:hypothetical protein
MITELVEIFSALELQSLLPRARRTGVIEIDLSVSPAPRSYLSAAKLVGSALTIALSTQRNDCQNSQCFFFKAGSSFLTCGASRLASLLPFQLAAQSFSLSTRPFQKINDMCSSVWT